MTKKQSTVAANSSTRASKPLAEFVEWQDSLLVLSPNLYRVRKWGDPIMVAQGGFSVHLIKSSNFQAVKLWSPEGGWGGVTNFLRIPHDEIMRLAAMQIEDDFELKKPSTSKTPDRWLIQKMNWLCKPDGTIYFSKDMKGNWQIFPSINWGTIALGGNLVAVERTTTVTLKLPNETKKREVKMAKLKGFRPSDWNRPLEDLLAEGLVHRCFCAYKKNHFGDSPKGIIYSPFFSLRDWDFPGKKKPSAQYLPMDWLEPKAS